MFDIKNIVEPNTLEEALVIIDSNVDYKIIAGGTDVLIKLRHGEWKGINLLSINKLQELKKIDVLENGEILIGAGVTFTEVFRSKVIMEKLTALGEGAVSMGGPQIRNMATIGGNVCNGAVSADSIASLMAFDAKLKLVSKNGERIVPINKFYKGPGSVDLAANEILTAIIIDKNNYNNKKSCYTKFSNRRAMDIAMLGVTVVTETQNNLFKDIRIGLSVAGPVPIRCYIAEELGRDKEINKENINKIGKAAVKSAKARDSWRASKAYREHLIEELTIRALEKLTIKEEK